MLDQAAKLRNMVGKKCDNKKAKIITVTSGKGGVGKSNFVINLGIYLQSIGKKIMIFDADIGMGNDDILMGITGNWNFFDVISGDREIEDVIIEGPSGIKLLRGGSAVNRIEELTEEEKERFFKKLSALKDFDYIIMDTGAGVSRNVLGFISCCDEVIFITTPEPTSITDCYSLIKATNHFKLKSTGSIIVNRVFSKKEGEEVYNKLKNVSKRFLNMDLKYLGFVYEDKRLTQSVREQKPFIINFPNSIISNNIKDIGNALIGEKNNSENTGVETLFKKIFNIFS
ncbi:MinD/ParA family protein [Clostridium fallax]|uniref:Flagellar biosynthesis protein FlhG n=1 Tax=Clostridium fallax TaxID=1533 RepID=A0A1M4UIP9_9CLOT|nr:MinD/ParA family protein [Clostridium fallax]SHE56616.1 flagellar biosynthesis protein FlhG [Clostridium fallax]SQB07587.1 MinD family ATPase [Clostridium fallax]